MIGRVVICALFALPLLARASATDLDLSPAQLECKVRRVTLAGGLTLAELQHKTSDGVVSGAIVLPFGDLDGRRPGRPRSWFPAAFRSVLGICRTRRSPTSLPRCI